MAADLDGLMTRCFPEVHQAYGERDCILYALGLGLGNDPIAADEFRYVYERDLRVLPTMATILGQPGFWIDEPGTGIDAGQAVHTEQSLVLWRDLETAGAVTGRTRVVEVARRREGRGSIVRVRTDLHDQADDGLIASLTSAIACRGNEGNVAPSPAAETSSAVIIPDRHPDACIDRQIPAQAALIYRLSGDINPLHVDLAVARNAGFERPILHGLATFGVAGFSLSRARGHAPLRSLSCRFTAPVYPGDTMSTLIWETEEAMLFRCIVDARGTVVLDRGIATLG